MEITGVSSKLYLVKSNMQYFREPSAWVAAAKMDSSFLGSYFYVEGSSDERFWKKFLDNQHIKICVCNGWECVVDVIHLHNRDGFGRCVGIIDRDFRYIQKTDDCRDANLFYTDFHDIEIMMYESDAFKHMLIALDRDNRIEAMCKYNQSFVLQYLYSITDHIGYLKLANINHHLNLIFKSQINHEFRKPKYEDIIDKHGNYLGVESLINKVCGFTSSCTSSGIDRKEVFDAFTKELVNNYDSRQLSNGHDVSIVLSCFFSKKCGIKEKYSPEYLENILHSSYQLSAFYQTQLYKNLCHWAESRNTRFFIE